ncbi:MAG: tetratricopeptide (TPR) repeat protein [Gammaproteobacteria bacterium]
MRRFRTTVCLFAVFIIADACLNHALGQQRTSDTKQTVAMSQDVFERLQEAQSLIESKQYRSGQAILRKLRAKPKLSAYETAQLWNLSGYAYYLQEKYPDAIGAYKNVLAQSEVPEAIIQSTLKTLSQLYFTVEDYQAALNTVKRLMAAVSKPSADVYMLLGQAYFQLKEYRQAIAPLNTAIRKYRAKGKLPRENWLLLLRVCYNELEEYKPMIAVLKNLIAHYPKERYVLTLAGVYSELGDTKKQLVLTEALYESGHLTQTHHVVNLANLYVLHGVPYKAAKVLQNQIDKQMMPPDERNLRLLSQAWYQAREDEKAIRPLSRAASLSGDGELHIRLAQAYINLNRWQDATDAAQQGLDKGGVRRADVAHIMLGMALFNQRKLTAARRAFTVAARDKRSRKAANQWIAYVDSESNRDDALEQTAPDIQRQEQDKILRNL